MKENRKVLLIYPEIQKPLLFAGLSQILIVSLIQTITLIFFLYKYRYGDVSFDYLKVMDLVFNIFYYRAHLLLILILPLILTILIFGRYFLVMSNKFTGPLYRIEKSLDEIIQTGQYKKITLRSHDLLINFAEKLNESFKSVIKS